MKELYWKIVLGGLFFLVVYLYVQDYRHKVTKYTVFIPGLHSEIKDKKVVFLSDTHFRENTSLTFLDRILIEIEEMNPDLIVFGGDIVHKLNKEKVLEHTKDFFYRLNKIAPTYLVYGNHDLTSGRLNEIKNVLKLSGAKVLDNEAKWINFEHSTAGFWLMGYCKKSGYLGKEDDLLSKIDFPDADKKGPKILLAHQPEYFEKYLLNEDTRPNLILSGHTHGGQVILPIIGGLFAPGQGKNPKYDFGMFTSDKYPGSRMIITRGIGNSSFPFRINNRPEIVLIKFE